MKEFLSPSQVDSKLRVLDDKSLSAAIWMRCERPNELEIKDLVALGIDHNEIVDALDPHEVPRISQNNGLTYFITRVPDVGDAFNSFTTPIMFVLQDSSIVTISRNSLERLWQPFIDKTPIDSAKTKHLFLQMADMIVSQYDVRVAAINRQMRALTSDVIGLNSKDIVVFTEHERKLNDYLDALIPTNAAIEKLLNGRSIKLDDDDADLVEDLSVDLEQVIARCKSLLRTMTNVRDSYRAVMDTRLNETMRVLTVATVALTVPTMLAGLFGMNVPVPGGDYPYMFWGIVGSSVVVSVAVAIYFSRRR